MRLKQGKAEQKTVYSRNPVEFAKKWEEEGGDFLHVVDLDGAFSGVLRNLESVRQIVSAIGIPCELGGGMRNEEAVQMAFDAGVSRVVIGTRASESMDFVGAMVKKFGGGRIAVGIDAKNGVVSVKGWMQSAGITALDLARQAEAAGVGTIIYTDIATDGMLEGPNFSEVGVMLKTVQCALVASGGVSKADDVYRLAAMENLYGVIIGRALYEETVSLPEVASRLKSPAL